MPRADDSLHTVHGAASWRIASDSVEAYVTRQGGHLGPVAFDTAQGRIQPFALPRGFDSVRNLRFKGNQAVFTAISGRRVIQHLDRDFLSAP